MGDNLSVWNESVSARAKRLRLPIEHFTGYHLICEGCERSFRCFREFEALCGVCSSKIRIE